MQMGYHVEQHHCNIDWLVHRQIHVHNMGLVVVQHVVVVELVVLVEYRHYVVWLGLDVVELVAVVEVVVYEFDSTLLIQHYIPGDD